MKLRYFSTGIGACLLATVSIMISAFAEERVVVRAGFHEDDLPRLQLHGTAKRGADGGLVFKKGEPWGRAEMREESADALSNLKSFTLSGWLHPTELKTGAGGNRIFFSLQHNKAGIDLVHHKDGRLRLSVNQWPDSVKNDSSTNKLALKKWTFFAVTYDSTKQTDNVAWYFTEPALQTDTSAKISLDKRRSYNNGAVAKQTGPIAIGNFNRTMVQHGMDRQFRGEIKGLQLQSTALAAEAITPTSPAPERVSDGLLALYDFQSPEGSVVKDRSGVGEALDLQIEEPNNVRRANGSLEIREKTLIRSEKPAAKITEAVKRSAELTIETWLKPANLKQGGPARIITISGDSSNRNVTLGQEADAFEARLRTTDTTTNGMPSLKTSKRSLSTQLTHVTYTRNRRGDAQLFINGKRSAKKAIVGKTANWKESFQFALGNEISKGRPWLGTYHLVAIYGRALSSEEIATNYQAGVDGQTGPAQIAGPSRSPKEKFFDEEVVPILSKHCLECHDTATNKGKLDLSKKSKAYALSDGEEAIIPGQSAQSLVWEVVESGEMPKKREPLTSAEKEQLRKWINDGAVWTTEEIDPLAHTFDRRATVNYIRRLTVPEYIETVRTVTGVDIEKEAREILPPDIRADGFSNTAYNLSVDLKHVESYAQLARIIVSRMDVLDFTKRYESKKGGLNLTDRSMRPIVTSMGRDVLRGDLSDTEIAAFRGITTTVAATGGTIEEGLAITIEAMLQSPRFLYRVENQRGDGEAWPVGDYELATRMSFIILGAAPDKALLKLAESGDLLAPKVMDAQITRMLDDSRAIKRSVEFINDWLNLNRLANMSPNAERFPNWSAELGRDMQRETLAFFEEVVWKQKRPLADLLNAKVTFATPQLAKHYGLEVQGDGEGASLYDLTAAPERGGLLTQGSVLTIGGDEASMVTRGLFVLNDLLRSGVKDPPPCVDTTPVAAKPGLTLRGIAEERVANKSCGGCHIKFEPLAYGLEKFNGVGAYHQADEHGNELREDGQILFPGTAKSIPYQTSAELMDLLAKSERVSQCLTWKVAQFAVGRPLGQPDAAVLDKIHQQAQASGGTYAAVVRAIIKSDLVLRTNTEAIHED
ncbi:MAG: hypothetical protein ACI8T1_000841 [Verrucomicrobiales bacterium]|jgi:hypothetical protein